MAIYPKRDLKFTNRLEADRIRISMDGRGRALDNIFVERLWRSVKYEEVYLHDYATVTDAILGLKKYFLFYNTERQHQSLDYRTPQEVCEGRDNGGFRTYARRDQSSNRKCVREERDENGDRPQLPGFLHDNGFWRAAG